MEKTPSFIDKNWMTEDGELFAIYDSFKRFFGIMTKGYVDRTNAETEKEEKKKIEGF